MLKAGKGELLKSGRAKPAVVNLVSTKQVVHGGRVSPSVGNCRTRRAVHKAEPLWAGQLSTRESCKPRRGAAVWLFRGGAREGGAFTVKTKFSKVKAPLPPARKGCGMGALCPCPRCQDSRDCSHVTSSLVTWVQSRTVEAAASFRKVNAMKAKLLRLAALSAPLLATGGAYAQAVTNPTTAQEALNTLNGSSAGYGTVMFGLAIASVGIMIGVKWIKRSRSAA